MPITLDDIDLDILATLEEDARISNVDLADRVGLSPSPCLRRVRRLEDAGVIRGYHADVDPAALGRSLVVLTTVRLSAHDDETLRAFEDACASWPEVTENLELTGDLDYLMKVAVADLDAYTSFVRYRLASIPAVSTYTSYVVLADRTQGAGDPTPRPVA